MVLKIEISENFICSCGEWFQSSQDKELWNVLLEKAVRFATGYKEIALITIEPKDWSIGNFFPYAKPISVGQNQFLVNESLEISKNSIKELVESEDFQRGLLWLILTNVNTQNDIYSLCNQILRIYQSTNNCSLESLETISLLDDGRSFHWLNAKNNLSELKKIIIDSSHEIGWGISNVNP